MDWLDLLEVQGTLKSLLQHHISKISILWCSAFFTVQLSHQHMTTDKQQIWLYRPLSVMLFFTMLPRCVVAFLPRSKCLWMSWLQSPPATHFGAQEHKSIIVSIVSPFNCHEVMGLDAIIFIYWRLCFKPAELFQMDGIAAESSPLN